MRNRKKYSSIKRLLSILLVFSMVFMMVPAAATEYITDDDIVISEAEEDADNQLEQETHDEDDLTDYPESDAAAPENFFRPASDKITQYQLPASSMTAADIQAALDRGDSEIIIDGDVDLAGAVLNISCDVTFSASGDSEITIYQTASEIRHMKILGDATISFDKIKLDGNGAGGGILIDWQVEAIINNVKVENCYAPFGGGIYVSSTATLTINDSEISGNTGRGGGIYCYSSSTLTVQNSTISGNTAIISGGGICVEIAVNVTLNNSIIRDNIAPSHGGGINILSDSALTVTGGEISNNSAASGGGVYVGTAGTFIMENAEIINNTASHSNGGGGVFLFSAYFSMKNGVINDNAAPCGGGVNVDSFSEFVAENSEICKNTSSGYGGGIHGMGKVNLTAVNISENTGAYGGGVSTFRATLFTMRNGNISNNTAMESGGGVYLEFTDRFEIGENGYIFDNRLSDGTQSNIFSRTGVPLIQIHSSIAQGTYGFSFEELQQSQIVAKGINGYELTPADLSALVYDIPDAEYELLLQGDSVYFILNDTPTQPATSENIFVSVLGSDNNDGTQEEPLATLEKAFESAVTGGIIYVMDALSLDKKVVFDQSKQVTLKGLNDASITYTGTDHIESGRDAFFYVKSGTLEISDITIRLPEQRQTNGSVMYIAKDAAVTLGNGAVISGGYISYAGGGGIYIDGGRLTMDDGAVIKNNYIANNGAAYGGGVYVASGSFTMRGGSIEGNTIHTVNNAESFGGGVAVGANGTFIMTGGTITGNAVDTAGGGLYVVPGGTVQMRGQITIDGNTLYNGSTNNVFLPDESEAIELIGSVTGKIGLTSGNPAYYRIVGVPAGYAISKADETAFCYDSGEYDIRLDENGNLILYWFTVDVDIDGEGVESSNKENETETGKDYETKLEPDEDHELPDEIEVWVGGEKLEPDEYEYDSDTGEVRIPGENVDDDISIIVKGDKKHTITVETTNVNADYTTGRITRKNTLTIHFTAANRYALPNEIQVNGICSYTYDKNTGVLVITEAESDIQITAKGVEQYVTLYFDANGGTCDTASKQITWSQATLGELPVPERTGYSFTGWFTVSETRVTANTENNLTEDLYLTAVWAAKTNIAYTVRHWVEYTESGLNPAYDGGTLHVVGAGEDTASYYLYEEAVYEDGRADGGLNLVPFLKEYFIDADGILRGIGLPASSRNEYHGIVSPDSSSVFNLYYDRQHYTITFDGNKGTVLGEAKKDIVYGSIYSAMPSAERAGYDFTGWYTDANAGEQVKAGDLYLTEGNQTLYAHWEPRGDIEIKVYHYTQDFDAYTNQPADSYTEHSNTTIKGTAGTTVDIHGIAIAGFKPADNNVYEFFVDPEGSLAANLYYDRIVTTIHFDSNGGSEIISRYLFAYGAKLLSFPNDPVKTGYDFNGWYLGKEETARKIAYGDELNEINPEIKTELTFYAHWKAKTYELPLEANGGKVLDAGGKEIQSITVTYDKRIGEIPDAERVGHYFMGWQDADGNEVTADTVVTTETIIDVVDGIESAQTIYAQYDPMKFTVTFDAAEGTLMGDSSIIVTYDKAFGDAGEFPAAARTGYTFEGWFFADGSEFKAADKCKLLDDVTVYAHWTPNTYQVSFDVNGGNALEKDYIIVTYDDVYPTLPVPSRTGYTFTGWQGDDGIKAGETVKITGPKTLKAKWTPLSFTITFDPNGGTCATETMTVTYDQAYGTLPAATRSNYKLNGWYTAATGGAQVTNSTIVKIVADTTLYAQWSADTGGNTGGGGGGGGTTYTITATAGDGVIITPEGKTSVSSGGSQEYIIKVEDGYTIIDVLVDGESIGAAEKYTFEKVSKNHTIHAEAKKDSLLTGDHIAYITGYEDGTVRPNANITRAETAMIFYRLLTEEARASAGSTSFTDVSNSDWYGTAVSTLAGAGIINGYTDNTFRPDNNITRAEFAAIAARFDSSSYAGSDLFADITGHWAANSINRAARKGWINGYPNNTFRPDNCITRAEAVTLVNAVLNRHIDADGVLSGMLTFSDNLDINAWYYYAIQEAANEHTFEYSDNKEIWQMLIH